MLILELPFIGITVSDCGYVGYRTGATYNTDRKALIQMLNLVYPYMLLYHFSFGNIAGIAPYAKADLGYNVSFTGNDHI